MKAAVLEETGKDPVIRTMDIPEPGPGEKRIQLQYAALNHRDVYIRNGQYARIQLPVIPGSDGCGTDTESGKRVLINPSFGWGDDPRAQGSSYTILGMPRNGTFAGYICVPEDRIHAVPEHLSSAGAAALPLAGVTAYRALFTRAEARKGEKVFIHGIGGGVALFAMQFALAAGCEVYVSSSSEQKIQDAVALGAKDGFLYNTEDWAKNLVAQKLSFDVIVESAGGPGYAGLLSIAAPGARIASYGGTRGKMDGLSPQVIFWKQLSLLGSTMGNDNDFAEMLAFVSRHGTEPVISKTFALENIADAYTYMHEAQQFGKIIIDIQS